MLEIRFDLITFAVVVAHYKVRAFDRRLSEPYGQVTTIPIGRWSTC